MANGDIHIRYRPSRRRINHPLFNPRSSQVERTNLSITPTGAAIVVRPPGTYLRRLDTRGQGTVGFF